MSLYRTISSTDLRRNDSFKLTLRSSEVSEDNRYCFMNSNDSTSSIVSDFSAVSEPERPGSAMGFSTLRTALSHTNNYAAMDFNHHVNHNVNHNLNHNINETSPLASGSLSPGGTRRVDCDAPNLEELQELLPLLFKEYQTLDDLFLREEFLSQNIRSLGDNFLNQEFDFDQNRILKPLSSDAFFSMRPTTRRSLIRILRDIQNNVEELHSMVSALNNQITNGYDGIMTEMRLMILFNSKSRKTYENSRVMLDSLLKIKEMTEDSLNEDFCGTLSSAVDRIIDLLYDFNSMTEDELKGLDSSTSTTTVSAVRRQEWETFCQLQSFIENNLKEPSKFTSEECPVASKILNQVKVIFEEYISEFNMAHLVNPHDKFIYEIVSFDDHIKSKKHLLEAVKKGIKV